MALAEVEMHIIKTTSELMYKITTPRLEWIYAT